MHSSPLLKPPSIRENIYIQIPLYTNLFHFKYILNVSIREYFSFLKMFIVCIRNRPRSKSNPFMCTHVDSYMFSTLHPRGDKERKKIKVVIIKLKLGLPPRWFFNLLMNEVVCSRWLNDMLGRSWMSYHIKLFFIIFIRCCIQDNTLQLLRNWWFYCGSSLIGGFFWRLCFKFVFGACICGVFVVVVSFIVMSILMLFKLHTLNDTLHLPL